MKKTFSNPHTLCISKIIIFFLLVYCFYLCFNNQEKASAGTTARPSANQNTASDSFVPVQKAGPLRNPFLASRRLQHHSASTFSEQDRLSAPILRGIVEHDNKRAAIFDYAGQSSFHSVGEKIGPYTIISLTETTALLAAPQQQITLQIEGRP